MEITLQQGQKRRSTSTSMTKRTASMPQIHKVQEIPNRALIQAACTCGSSLRCATAGELVILDRLRVQTDIISCVHSMHALWRFRRSSAGYLFWSCLLVTLRIPYMVPDVWRLWASPSEAYSCGWMWVMTPLSGQLGDGPPLSMAMNIMACKIEQLRLAPYRASSCGPCWKPV